MARIKHAVLDAGPIIHLHEIDSLQVCDVILDRVVAPEVVHEVGSIKIKARTAQLDGLAKDFSKLLVEEYDLDLGEAQSIAVCRKEKISLFFTDDLDARDIARRFGMEPHGTLALSLRALREGLLDSHGAVSLIDKLYDQSSLYLTKDLVVYAHREIQRWVRGK